MKMNLFLKPLLLILLIMAAPSFASAEGNIHFGGTEVHPSFGVTYRHDDNVYLNDGKAIKKVDDNIMIYTPAIELKNNKEDNTFLLRYKADIYRYSDITKEDKTDSRLTALVDTRSPSGLIFMLRDDYVDTADPASSEFTDLDERTQNILSANLGYYMLDRLAVIAKYKKTNHDYDESSLNDQDRDETIVGGKIRIDLLPKTSFYIEYENESIEYDTVGSQGLKDSDTDRVLAGVKGQVTPKVKVAAAVGYDKRDYDNAAKEDFSTFIVNLKVSQQFSEFTRLSLAGHRKNVESFYTTNNFYTENKLALDFFYRFNHKISSNLNGYFANNDYNQTSRKDDLLGYSLDINYDIRPWLTASVGYAYKERDSNVVVSNINAENYEDNQYYLRLRAWL